MELEKLEDLLVNRYRQAEYRVREYTSILREEGHSAITIRYFEDCIQVAYGIQANVIGLARECGVVDNLLERTTDLMENEEE